ncbi:MAG: hypothetical protein WAU59_18870 [Rhodoplanes sp.]
MSGIAGLHPLQTLHTWRRRSHKGRRESLCSACLAIAKTTLSGREWISLRRTAQRQRRYLTDGEPMIADRPGPSDEIATLRTGHPDKRNRYFASGFLRRSCRTDWRCN